MRNLALAILLNILKVAEAHEKRHPKAVALKKRLGACPSYIRRKLRRLYAYFVLVLRRKAKADQKTLNLRTNELIRKLEKDGFDKAEYLASLKERGIDLSEFKGPSDNE
ncbi:MAG: hypothetical protein K2X81_04745 [Candidatus Obscuribacterales bacterium]|nr:hypothetical protein [Candidatus Obscuribacterales bacterium]